MLKRAGLVMAVTAWETYVEDLICELVAARLDQADGEYFKGFVEDQLEKELKSFHNPNSQRTHDLFRRYLRIDVTERWMWGGYNPESACKKLNKWLSLRGEVVHRAKPRSERPEAHLVKRDELEKGIVFFRHLVEATERSVESESKYLGSG